MQIFHGLQRPARPSGVVWAIRNQNLGLGPNSVLFDSMSGPSFAHQVLAPFNSIKPIQRMDFTTIHSWDFSIIFAFVSI